MDEKEAREHVDNLLECQREVIALAALAGVRFDPVERRIAGSRFRHKQSRFTTRYVCWVPTKIVANKDDVLIEMDPECYIGEFDDRYEAACAAMAIINYEPPVEKPEDKLFKLEPGNEQPHYSEVHDTTLDFAVRARWMDK